MSDKRRFRFFWWEPHYWHIGFSGKAAHQRWEDMFPRTPPARVLWSISLGPLEIQRIEEPSDDI